MFFFHLLPQALLTPLDPPWSILLLWRSWAARRILMHRAIVSPILAPYRARESATMVRRILVISPGSSLYARRAVLVFAKAKMRGHFPLVCSIKCPSGKPQASFQRLREISWASVRQMAFSLLCRNFINRLMWLGLWWLLALWGFELPSIQRNFGGLIVGQYKSFVSIPWHWESDKSKYVISSLFVP